MKLYELTEVPNRPSVVESSSAESSPLPRLFQPNTAPFRHIGVVLGDPTLPDKVKPTGYFCQKDLEEVDDLLAIFNNYPEYRVTMFDHHDTLIEDLRWQKPDIVLNLCDTGLRNNPTYEMHIPAMLELLGIPYTGAAPDALSLAYDKATVGAIASTLGIPSPHEYLLKADAQLPSDWNIFPAFVKPNCADNSVGIIRDAVCYNRESLQKAINELRQKLKGEDLLIQEFLPGNEYRICLLGNAQSGYHFMPITEIRYDTLPEGIPNFVTYENKYGLSEEEKNLLKLQEAELQRDIEHSLKQCCIALAERLKCYDFVVFDFRTDRFGTIKLIDVNPNPSWEREAIMTDYNQERGYRYEEIIRYILESAQHRYMHSAPKQRHLNVVPARSEEAKSTVWRQALQRNDVDAVRQLCKDTGVFYGMEITVCAEMVEQALDEGSAVSGYHYLLVERDGKLLGMSCFGPACMTSNTFDLYWILAAKETQGSGLALELLNRSADIMVSMGATQMVAETSSRDPFIPAQKFYIKHGFKEAARIGDYYGPNDAKLIYCKILAK